MPEELKPKDTGMCPHGNFPDSCPKCQTKPEFEHEHYPEIVEGGKGIKRLERLGVKEDLTTAEKRTDLFTRLSDGQYKKML